MNFELCEACRHYSFNFQEGILCGLTHQKPDFADSCPGYLLNPDKEKSIEPGYHRTKSFKGGSRAHDLPELSVALRNWGIGLIVLGIIHLFLSDALSPVWGALILILGIINLTVVKKEMFIVNGAALLFVGLLNLAGGFGLDDSIFWSLFGVMQVVWGWKEVKKYRVYCSREKIAERPDDLSGEISPGPADIPDKHSILGIISLVMFGVIVAGQFLAIIIADVKSGANPGYFTENPGYAMLIGLGMIGGLLLCIAGTVLGVIGIFQKNENRLYSILGTVLNSLLLLFNVMSAFVAGPF